TTKMRQRLGESLATIQKYDAPVEQATTPSLEALKAYTEAWNLHVSGEEAKSLPFFKHAIELDPNFALAYAAMGQAYANLGEDELAIQLMKQAFDRRDRTSERRSSILPPTITTLLAEICRRPSKPASCGRRHIHETT